MICSMIITDTHKAVKLITDTGLPYEQAEGIVNALNGQGAEFVTKDHLKAELKELETSLTIRMIVILALFTAVIKWL